MKNMRRLLSVTVAHSFTVVLQLILASNCFIIEAKANLSLDLSHFDLWSWSNREYFLYIYLRHKSNFSIFKISFYLPVFSDKNRLFPGYHGDIASLRHRNKCRNGELLFPTSYRCSCGFIISVVVQCVFLTCFDFIFILCANIMKHNSSCFPGEITATANYENAGCFINCKRTWYRYIFKFFCDEFKQNRKQEEALHFN